MSVVHLKIFYNIDEAKRAFYEFKKECGKAWKKDEQRLMFTHSETNTVLIFKAAKHCTPKFYRQYLFKSVEGTEHLDSDLKLDIETRIQP